MIRVSPGNRYSRKQVWAAIYSDKPYPNGGPWATGYVNEGNNLIAFCNINSPGRTGHDFPNEFDEGTGNMTWYGKPNAHSEQPTFRSLFKGDLRLQMFARWDNKTTFFTYLGTPTIIRFSNDIVINDNTKTIRIELNFKSKFSQEIEHLDIVESSEGTKEQTFSTTYERNPRLRAECIKIHGCVCSVCGFDFEKSYGPLGKNFCHVHHIRPLSEVGQSHTVSSRDDMIPVCPNCHAMLHRTIPALLPDQLIKIINARS
jgi:5-methylcytosine-specific restriction enzyme A